MAGWWDAAVTLTLLTLLCITSVHPFPQPALLPPPPARPYRTTAPPTQRQGGGEGRRSLMDTLLRMDDMLKRHNDYNDVMLESGEEDDQLSRLLYRLQHGDRVREGWYDEQPALPPPPDQRLDATTNTQKTQRARREHRLGSTGLTKPAAKALTRKERKSKKTKGKKGVGKRT